MTGTTFTVSGVGDLPITVGAGTTYNLSVSFSPMGTGTTAGQLTIVTNDSSNGTMVIGLNGTGVDAGPPVTLTSLNCNDPSLTGAGTDNCTVTLNGAAATGGFTISLMSNSSAVTVPASVTVPAGATSAGFTATVASVSSAQTVTLTASSGSVVETFALQLYAAGGGGTGTPVLTGLTCASNSMTGDGTDSCMVTLNQAAAAGGFVVGLASNNNAATVPASVTVPAGATSAGFTATVASVSSAQTVTLTASAGSVVETFVLQLNAAGGGGTSAPVLTGLTCASNSMTGSGTDSCTVTLNQAAATGGFAVGLASDNSAVAVPASVTVPTGATSAGFTATVSSVTSAQTVTLTASAGTVVQSFILQLAASGPILAINGTSLAFGNVNLNTPTTQTLTLTASGILPLTVTAATVIGPGFSVSGVTLPLTLNGGQTATLNAQFDPAVAGPATGTLTIVSTSLTNPLTVINLSGTGVASAYEVDLTWDAPTTSPDPVSGYIVFRSPSGASMFAPLNATTVTQNNYTDTTVQNGQTYDYIVESIDASGVESVPSNTASAIIP